MWVESYKRKLLTLDIELSTFCNAKCPQCSRTDRWNKLKKKEWLPTEQVTLDQFKQWFSPEDLNGIKNIHFSGTYGDPGMCKDLFDIVEYIITSSTCTASINTNGGMRDEMFWWKLGVMGGQKLHVIFDVDGIDQEMHSFYRQDVKLSKVLNNLEALAETPCKVSVLTVLFKHNQNYLEEIRDMCRAIGVTKFDEVEGNNFGPNPVYEFEDIQGKVQQLEQITRKDREQGIVRLDRRVRDHRHASNNTTKKEYDNIDSWRNYDEIHCLALAQNNLKVSVRGTITPCCYLSSGIETTAVYKSEPYPYQHLTVTGNQKDGPHPVMENMLSRINDFQLGRGKSISELLSDKWWEDYLPGSWDDKKDPIFGCAKICGRCTK